MTQPIVSQNDIGEEGRTIQAQPAAGKPFTKRGIGGWLVLPALVLIFVPISAVLKNYDAYQAAQGFGAVRIYLIYPILAIDAIILISALLLGRLFFRKRRIAPPCLILHFALVFCMWNYADAFLHNYDVPIVQPTAHCLFFIPYLTLSRRVQNTFTEDLDRTRWLDRIFCPVSSGLEALYRFLRRTRKLVIPGVVVFVALNMLLYALVHQVFVLHEPASQFLDRLR